MGRPESDVGGQRARHGPEMITAMRRGVIEALLQHKQEDRSIITWDRENQGIVEVPAAKISNPDELN